MQAHGFFFVILPRVALLHLRLTLFSVYFTYMKYYLIFKQVFDTIICGIV